MGSMAGMWLTHSRCSLPKGMRKHQVSLRARRNLAVPTHNFFLKTAFSNDTNLVNLSVLKMIITVYSNIVPAIY